MQDTSAAASVVHDEVWCFWLVNVEARGRTIRHLSARGQLQAKEQVSPGTAAAAAAGGAAVNIKQGLHRCQPLYRALWRGKLGILNQIWMDVFIMITCNHQPPTIIITS